MNQKLIDPLSEVEAFLRSRASKNKRRKNIKDPQPTLHVYTTSHVFEGDVLKITSEFVEIRQMEWSRVMNFEGYRYTGLCVTILRKEVIAVGVNKKELGEP